MSFARIINFHTNDIVYLLNFSYY